MVLKNLFEIWHCARSALLLCYGSIQFSNEITHVSSVNFRLIEIQAILLIQTSNNFPKLHGQFSGNREDILTKVPKLFRVENSFHQSSFVHLLNQRHMLINFESLSLFYFPPVDNIFHRNLSIVVLCKLQERRCRFRSYKRIAKIQKVKRTFFDQICSLASVVK